MKEQTKKIIMWIVIFGLLFVPYLQYVAGLVLLAFSLIGMTKFKTILGSRSIFLKMFIWLLIVLISAGSLPIVSLVASAVILALSFKGFVEKGKR